MAVRALDLCAQPNYPVVSPPPGSHYEVMKEVGKAVSSRIRKWVQLHAPLRSVLEPYVSSREGAAALKAYSETHKKAFPKYWDEMRGLADGSGMPIQTAVLMNFRWELLGLAKAANSKLESPLRGHLPLAALAFEAASSECSDILQVDKDGQWLAHNEDNQNIFPDTAFIVNATFLESDGTTSGYYGFHMPLSLFGHMFGVNRHGVYFTMDSITNMSTPQPGDVAIFYLARHIADATDFNDAVQRAMLTGFDPSYQFSSAFASNVGSYPDGVLGNIEVGPGDRSRLQSVTVHTHLRGESPSSPKPTKTSALPTEVEVEVLKMGDVRFHFNNLRRGSASTLYNKCGASNARLGKANRYLKEFHARRPSARNALKFAIDVLGDSGDDAPMYLNRNHSTKWSSNWAINMSTVATVMFDGRNGVMKTWFSCNPRHTSPGMTVDFQDVIQPSLRHRLQRRQHATLQHRQNGTLQHRQNVTLLKRS